MSPTAWASDPSLRKDRTKLSDEDQVPPENWQQRIKPKVNSGNVATVKLIRAEGFQDAVLVTRFLGKAGGNFLDRKTGDWDFLHQTSHFPGSLPVIYVTMLEPDDGSCQVSKLQ